MSLTMFSQFLHLELTWHIGLMIVFMAVVNGKVMVEYAVRVFPHCCKIHNADFY